MVTIPILLLILLIMFIVGLFTTNLIQMNKRDTLERHLTTKTVADKAIRYAEHLTKQIDEVIIGGVPKFKPANAQPETATGVSMSMTKPPETIDCATCGCMVKKELAIPGSLHIHREAKMTNKYNPNDVRWLPVSENVTHPFMHEHEREVFFIDYYCKRCAPKPVEPKQTESTTKPVPMPEAKV